MYVPTLQEASGAYAKKWLVLNVAEAGSRKKEPVGRVVIDLAEFAKLDGQVRAWGSVQDATRCAHPGLHTLQQGMMVSCTCYAVHAHQTFPIKVHNVHCNKHTELSH